MALPNKAKIPVGTVLAGKHRITREIGRGGMAAVYEAENVDIGKRVAIKVLAQELTTSAVVVERFLREARAAAAIRSPYICDVYDSGRLEDGRPFLVLELLEGESLYERMTVVRNLDAETTVAIITQVCRGLAKAHAASIVHRDLKPENIFLTKDEEGRLCAKILDFGLAKFYAPMNNGDAKQARLTREGAVFGTPAYMSPEQVRGQGAVDHRADLWALGCITFECLTGRTVWQTDQGVAMTFAQIANAPLPRPAEFRPDLPPSFTAWFDRALSRSIDQRYQTAKEFADELAIALEVSTSPGRGADASAGAHVADEIAVDFSGMGTPEDAIATVSAPLSAPVLPTATPAAPSFGPPPARPLHAGLPAPDPELRASPAGTPKLAVTASQDAGDAGHGAGPAGKPRDIVETTPAVARGKSSGGRGVLVFGILVLLGGAGYAGYRQFVQQPQRPSPAPTSTAVVPTAAPTAEASAIREAAPPPLIEVAWMPQIGKAQEAIVAGNLAEAQRLAKEAFDKSAHGVPRTMFEHLTVALKEANEKAPCRLTGLARPRTYDLSSRAVRRSNASRPSIAIGPRGPVVAWTDAHEHEWSEHAYAVTLDDTMRTATAPVDVTPEGTAVRRAELTRVGDRLVLSYRDERGPEAGVYLRWLDADGRIAGPPVAVASKLRGGSFPSFAPAAEGAFVVWSDEGEPTSDSEDLFLRRLSPTLEPAGDPVRLTDIAPVGPQKPRARYASAAVQGDALHIAFRVERSQQHLIHHMRLPLADAEKAVEPAGRGARADRMAGMVELANTDKAPSDSPALACADGACFLVWHGNAPRGGTSAAFIDPASAQPLWRKKFSINGMAPAVTIAPDGRAQLAWYENGRVATASLSRDGIGPPTVFARVSKGQPMPSIAPGEKMGEWYIAWLDYEAGYLEPYAARVQCR